MFAILPYHVDVPMQRWPWMNWVLIGVTVLLYPFCVSAGDLTGLGEQLALGGESWIGIVGHLFVHADFLHLFGNMLFLWVFGNAVCAKVGNLAYAFLYLGLGVAAGGIAYLIDPSPAVGASGAINGIVGMFVVWYLLNEISCFYAYWFFGSADAGSLSVSSFWLVLLFLVFDIWGAIRGEGNVGYIAHLAGFVVGFGAAILMLVLQWIEMDEGERSLLQVLWDREEAAPATKKRISKPSGKAAKKPDDRAALAAAIDLEKRGRLQEALREYEKVILSSDDNEVRGKAQLRKNRLEEKLTNSDDSEHGGAGS